MVELDVYTRKCDLLSNSINLRNRRDTEPYVRCGVRGCGGNPAAYSMRIPGLIPRHFDGIVDGRGFFTHVDTTKEGY